MHVGIDFTCVLYNRGVSRYTHNLARALTNQPEVRLTLFGYSFKQKNKLQHSANQIPFAQQKFLSMPIGFMEKMWQFGLNPVSKHVKNIDVFHSWDWMQPPDTTFPIVSTIHDLAILKFPESAHPTIVKAHEKSWQTLKKNNSHIIAVSQATKTDIVRLLGYPSYMVHVVHEALPNEFLVTANSVTEEIEASIMQQLELNKPYILFVGTQEPRKNLANLISAWQPLAKEYELIIAGAAGWDNSEKVAVAHKPRFLGQVTDRQLCVLYANAQAFAYPSLYEGFGLPILESFHHGTPVVTSNNSGMAEVAGNAAELVDPQDVNSITQGLVTVLNETQQQQQKRLQRMIIRQQMFNWGTAARETVAVYKQALNDFT